MSFSRSESTRVQYEQRIDELFAGAKANLHGAIVLDRSDLLDMLGYGDMPVQLDEAKVLLNQKNHPEMTADAWKRVPEWLDNPAAVLKSRTHDKRLVFVPEEMMNGAPVYVIVEPDTKGLRVHALVNAYTKDGNPAQAMRDIERDLRNGQVDYVNKEKARELLGRSGLQLPRLPSLNTSRNKILTEKNLQGYLKNNPALSVSHSGNTFDGTSERLAQLRQQVQQAVGAANMRHIDIVSRADLARPDNAEKLRGAEGFYDPTTRRVTLIAEALPNARTAQFVAWHELGHRKMDVSGWQDWRNVLAQSRLNPTIRELAQIIGHRRKAAGEHMTLDIATEEASVELYAAMKNGDYDTISEKYGVTVPQAMRAGLGGYFARFAQRLKAVLAKAFGGKAQDFSDAQVFELLRGIDRAQEVSGNLNDRETKFSLNEDADSDFARAVDDVVAGKVAAGYIDLGATPDVLKLLGVPDGKVRISGGTIEKAMADYLNRQNTYDKNRHAIKPEDMKWLPANLNDPVAVFSSTTKADSFVVLTEILERENGRDKPVIAALHLDKGKYGLDLVNIASVYGRSDQQLVRAFDTDLLYLNKQKGRQFLKTHPLQLHWDITSDADLLKRNIKTNEDLAQDSGSLKFSRGNPLADGGRKWFNEMGELNAGVAAYNKLADVIRPALAKVKMANNHPQAFTRYMRDYRAQLCQPPSGGCVLKLILDYPALRNNCCLFQLDCNRKNSIPNTQTYR